ncbi:MAG: peptidylprolyl isomerase [Bacillota bacterium]|nr:peptidylprolyl isomerase [Bacillota bacterium]
MKKSAKFTVLLLAVTLMCATFAGCGKKDSGNSKNYKSNVVVMSVKGYGDITIELYPQYAPETVANFKKLVSDGFYDNTIFHRVIKGFMIQGGGYDANSTSSIKNASTIKGEFSKNGFTQNTLVLNRGVIAMARAQSPDSASSEFFIMHGDDQGNYLTGNYAGFGKVIHGMDVVDKIANCAVSVSEMGEQSKPVNYPVVTSVKFK